MAAVLTRPCSQAGGRRALDDSRDESYEHRRPPHPTTEILPRGTSGCTSAEARRSRFARGSRGLTKISFERATGVPDPAQLPHGPRARALGCNVVARLGPTARLRDCLAGVRQDWEVVEQSRKRLLHCRPVATRNDLLVPSKVVECRTMESETAGSPAKTRAMRWFWASCRSVRGVVGYRTAHPLALAPAKRDVEAGRPLRVPVLISWCSSSQDAAPASGVRRSREFLPTRVIGVASGNRALPEGRTAPIH